MRPYLIFLDLTFLVSACTSPQKEQAPVMRQAPKEAVPANVVTLSKEEMQLGGVQTGSITQRTMTGGITVNGMLDVPPEQLISINAPMGGIVESTSLLQGQHVHKGDQLAVISNPAFIQLQQEYQETQGKLAYAKAERDRQQELVKEEVAPIKNLQRAEAEYAALRAQAVGQAARLKVAGLPVGAIPFASNAILRAPKDAFVRDVKVTVGQTVTATDALFMLVDPSHLHVELTVYEKDIPKLHKGQGIRFGLPGDVGMERKASIYLIGQNVDAEQRTVRVHGHLEEDKLEGLLPGMYVRAVVETGSESLKTLPETAVVDFEGKPYVFRQDSPVTNGETMFTMLPILKGADSEGYVEVTIPGQAHAANQLYVVKGAYALLGKLKNAGEEE